MALPWLRLLDTAFNLADLAFRGRPAAALRDANEQLAPARAATEARLAGVVVAALKEAFDRDHQRLELEREQREAERRRAERLLKIEIARQAGDREVGRLRLLTGLAVAGWLGTLYLILALGVTPPAVRAALGTASVLLLAALATAFVAQTHVGGALARLADPHTEPQAPSSGASGTAAPWLLISGLAVVVVAVLLR
jgi:hypothetical protein